MSSIDDLKLQDYLYSKFNRDLKDKYKKMNYWAAFTWIFSPLKEVERRHLLPVKNCSSFIGASTTT